MKKSLMNRSILTLVLCRTSPIVIFALGCVMDNKYSQSALRKDLRRIPSVEISLCMPSFAFVIMSIYFASMFSCDQCAL